MNTEMFPLLFSLWALTSVCLALIWYIHQLNKTMADERASYQREREEMRADMDSERRNLYDRIQAGTLQNYKLHEDVADNEVEEPEDDLIDLEDAREELEHE